MDFFRGIGFPAQTYRLVSNCSETLISINHSMSKVIKLKRGLDIRLVGEAEKTVVQMPVGSTYAVVPDSFPRITPKLLVSEGARVKAGTVFRQGASADTLHLAGERYRVGCPPRRKTQDNVCGNRCRPGCRIREIPGPRSG